MSGIKKTAICGLWHVHAGGYIDEARKYSQVVGIWDEDPKRLREGCGIEEAKALTHMMVEAYR